MASGGSGVPAILQNVRKGLRHAPQETVAPDAMPQVGLKLLERKAGVFRLLDREKIHQKLRALVRGSLSELAIDHTNYEDCPHGSREGSATFKKAVGAFEAAYPCAQFPKVEFCKWAGIEGCNASTVVQAQDLIVSVLRAALQANKEWAPRRGSVNAGDVQMVLDGLAAVGEGAGVLGVAAERIAGTPDSESDLHVAKRRKKRA